MAQVTTAEFCHPANGEGGWYVEVRGTYDEVMGEAGMALAEASALDHGWTPDDRASAGFPSAHNLRTYERSYWFHGKGTWAYHLDCWCRHQFCQHTNRMGSGCKADAPYTRQEQPQ